MNQKTIRQRAYDENLFPGSDTLHPVLARIYAGRNIPAIEQTDYSLAFLVPPDQLKDIDGAVDLLVQALEQQQRILVVGDFDVDGATSTTLAVEVLRAFGAGHVDYLVPDRFRFGYGLTPEIVEVALEYKPDLIITVDNGIASLSGVEAAHRNRVKVLITDHHLPGQQLPAADAIVNPNQPDDPFPSKSLAGVGVIFYVMMALRKRLRELGWFEKNDLEEPNLANWLDLVALGTVADMVGLDYNNRILVANGLARIRNNACHPGMSAILQLANRNPAQLSSTDLGFVLAPRLNAAGRLDDMSVGIECLLSGNVSQAMEYATQLENLNAERREIQADMELQAEHVLDQVDTEGSDLPHGVCLYDERWHQGIVGLIASRIKERTNRPAIAFARGDDGNLKGSARSVAGINIRDALDSVATHNPGLLIKFGGHAMAAGLSISEERFDEFAQAFSREIGQLDHNADEPETIYTDGELLVDELTIEFADLLKSAGPWGQGFPEPLFAGSFEVMESRVLKQKHLKLLLRVGENRTLDAIAFNSINPGQAPRSEEPEFDRVDVVYRLDINEFRGDRKAQLIIDHIQTNANA